MSSEFGLYRSGVYEKYFDDGAAVSADSQFWLPGHELHILGDINIGHTPIRLRAGGTKDNPIVVTSVGGVLSNYTDLLDTGVFTWTVVPTWSAQSYDGGSVVYHSGTDAYYTAIADITYSSSPADDPGTHVSWKDVGGKVYQCVLPAAYQKYLAYVEVNGDSTYARRQVGNNIGGGGTAGQAFYRIGEWAQGGPGHTYWAGYPDFAVPTHLFVRSDTDPVSEAAIETMIGCFGFGAIEIHADATWHPDYVTVEGLDATLCGQVVAGSCSSGATQDLLGTIVRDLTATRCGMGVHHNTYGNTTGGNQFAVREWLVEDCALQRMGRAGVRTQNVGIGTIRGVSVVDYSLQISNGGIYLNAFGGGVDSYDQPDNKYIENCYVSQSGGLYAEQVGSDGNMFQDHGDAYYHDGNGTNAYFSACRGETIPQTGAYLCRANAGGLTSYIGMEGEGVNGIAKISNSAGRTTYPKNAVIAHSSFAGVTQDNAILVANNTDGTITLSHIAAEGDSVNFIWNGDTAGASAIASTDNVLEGILTSAAGTTADITEVNISVTTGLFSSGVVPSTPLLNTATTDPVELVPAMDLSNAADALNVTHGVTTNGPFVVVCTLRGIAGDSGHCAELGVSNSDEWRFFQFDAVNNISGRKRESAATYLTSNVTFNDGEDIHAVFRCNADYTFDLWANGTAAAAGSSGDNTDPVTIIGNLLKIGDGAGPDAGCFIRDLIVYEGLLTDAECIAL